MKRYKLTGFTILIFALTLASMVLVSGTFAKYTSSGTGFDVATVAKWSIELGGSEIATSTPQTVSIDLFSTIYDTSNSAAEEDVSGEKKIAPGTQGEFAITIQNKSEVTASYSLTSNIVKSDSTLPILFSTDGGSTWDSTLTISSAAATRLDVGSNADTINVKWKWAFSGDDAVDTALGIKARDSEQLPSVRVNISIVATQVD